MDLDAGTVDVRRSYRLRSGVGTEKDTKTHQMRRLALDSETVALLTEHKTRCDDRLRSLGVELTDDMYVFGSARTFDPSNRVPPPRCPAGTTTSPGDSASTPTSTPCGTTRLPNC